MRFSKQLTLSLVVGALLPAASAVGANESHFEVSSYRAVTSGPDIRADDIIQFNYTHQLGDTALNFGSSRGERDSRYQFGITGERIGLTLFGGHGDRYSQLQQGGFSVDPHFFHGGAFYKFSYRGIAGDVPLRDDLGFQFGAVRLDSGDLDTRSAWYTGVQTTNTMIGIVTGYRESDPTATGLSISRTMNNGVAHFQQMEHESGARYRKLSWNQELPKDRWYQLSFESGRNPLYVSNNQNRLMFRLGGTLGRVPMSLNASATTEEPVEGKEKPKSRKRAGAAAIVIGAVAGAAAMASSGDDDKDDGARLDKQHDAAREVLNEINPVSVRQNREHGGWIYRNSDGTYGYTEPVAGDVDSVNIGDPDDEVPSGSKETATYHTHGGDDPRYDNENFSFQDLLSDTLNGVDGYLATPKGKLKYHDVDEQEVTTIGTVATE